MRRVLMNASNLSTTTLLLREIHRQLLHLQRELNQPVCCSGTVQIPARGGQNKADMLATLSMITLTSRADARRMMDGNGPTVAGLYRILGVDWLLAEQEEFSSATALRFVDLNGLPQDNTMRPVNTRFLTDVRRRARELIPDLRKGNLTTENKPNNKHHKMYRKLSKPPGQLPGEYSREFPRATSVEGDDRRYKGLETLMGNRLFASYDPLDIKNAKYLIVASSDYLYTP